MILGIERIAKHAHVGLRESEGGYRNLANLTREVSAVTGACLAIRRSVFKEIGGFDERLAVTFNDVLLCQRALSKGYRNIVVAEPLVMHREAGTRGRDDTPAKIAQFLKEADLARQLSPDAFGEDPYYNPNLSLERPYHLAWPPRTVKPWR
jgi:Glycosyltransferase like family 2